MAESMEILQTVVADPPVVAFVAGAFERLGVHVRDTGEAFACVHRGERIDSENRIVHGQVDYTVEVESAGLARLGQQVRAGAFGEWLRFGRWYRQWRRGVSRRGSDRGPARG